MLPVKAKTSESHFHRYTIKTWEGKKIKREGEKREIILTTSTRAFYTTVMKKTKNRRYNNKPDEVIISPEGIEKWTKAIPSSVQQQFREVRNK